MTNSKTSPHIVVIGAGIIGASIAFHLSLRGARVTVLEAERPGKAASSVSFAWINARDKNPRTYHDLNRRSLDMWDRFQRRLGADVGLTWGGEMRWAATNEGAKELSARVEELQAWGYPVELLEPTQVKELEPGIETGPVTAGSYTAVDGHVDTAKVIKACFDKATEGGVELRPDTKVWKMHMARTQSGETNVEILETNHGEISADIVVLATGADTTDLAAMAGIEIQHHWTFGATIITDQMSPVFENVSVIHTPRDASPMMNFRQFPEGYFMMHGGSHGGAEDESMGKTQEEVEEVFEAAKGYIPSLSRSKIKEVRRGRRPMPEDGHPILGFSEDVPNLYFATMHSGVSLAPLVGEFAATEIVDSSRIDMLEPYRVERFTRQ